MIYLQILDTTTLKSEKNYVFKSVIGTIQFYNNDNIDKDLYSHS